MKHREVTITLRLTVPDSPELDKAVTPRLTMLDTLLYSVGSVLLQKTVGVLREELGDAVEAIENRHTVGAAFEESEDW